VGGVQRITGTMDGVVWRVDFTSRLYFHALAKACFVNAPFDSAATSNEEKYEAVENGQLALVYRREEFGPKLELPVKLKICHGHLATTKESRYACLKPHHYRQPPHEFEQSADPELGTHRWLELGKHPQDLLDTMEREHEPRHDSHQGVRVVRILFKTLHERLSQTRDLMPHKMPHIDKAQRRGAANAAPSAEADLLCAIILSFAKRLPYYIPHLPIQVTFRC
jgi:hypothetical protein